MDREIETTLGSLRPRHLSGVFGESSAEAKSKILDLIAQDAVVGIGL